MVGGLLLFTLASILCAAAPSPDTFLGGRALQGLGAAMLLPNSLAILSASFTGEAKGRAVGTWAAAGAIAGATSPLLGGWLVDGPGWPFIFLLNVPIAAGAILLGWRFVPESANEERPPPDWLRAALAPVRPGRRAWGLPAWSASGPVDAASGAAIGGGPALLFAFLFVEHRRGAEAMVPL